MRETKRIFYPIQSLVLMLMVLSGFANAQTTYYLTTSGGSYATEKWVSITTGANGTGTQVWGQGNGTYGNGQGLVTDEAITLTGYEGQTLYLNLYDRYGDSWDGTSYLLEETASGPTIISGTDPDNGIDNDSGSGWEAGQASEIEASVSFTIPSVCTSPSTQASSVVISNVDDNSMDISWTRGNGDNVLVVVQSGTATSSPNSGTSYSANAAFSSGDAVGSGYTVYNGTGTSVSVTGLSGETTYHVGVYEYLNTDVCYNSTGATSNATTTKTPTSVPYSESFESGAGIWTETNSSGFQWTRQASGATTSTSTGPNAASDGSSYYFTEASSGSTGNDDYLTATFNFANYTSPQIEFDFHMYGSGMGTLYLQVNDNGAGWTTLETISGQQHSSESQAWTKRATSLASYAGSTSVQLRFWGEMGSSYASDMAIDNINITNLCTPPTTQASSLVFSNVGLSQIDISWTRGNGNNVLVIAKAASAPADPTAGTTYSANAAFGSGTQVNSDGYAVYNGSGTSFTMTGLNDNTTYHLSIYEYATTGTCYNTTELTASQATLSYDQDSDVDAPVSQVAATTISSISNDAVGEVMNVFKFKIEDQGAGDGVATKITNVRVVPGASNTADWTDNIQGAVLLYDGVAVTTSSVTINDNYIDFAIAEGNMNIADGEVTKEATVQAYLNTSNIVDGAIIQMMVDADAHGWTTGSASSTFASDLGTDVNGNNITIDVTATALAYATNTSNTLINQNMTAVTVEAVDANGNRDLGFSSQIDITSTGTLSSSPQSATASSGLATFSSINHTAAGTGLTLNAERNGTGDWDITSSSFDITETPDICTDAIDIYGATASLNMANANNDYDDGEVDAGSESSFSMGDWNSIIPCNSGSYHSAYYYSDFKDLWVKLDIPDGTDEFTIDVSNWSGSGYAYFLPYYGTCGSITQMLIADATNGVTNNNTPDLTGNGSITFSGPDVVTGSTSTIYLRVIMHDNNARAGSVSASCATLTYPSFDITGSAPQPNDVYGDAIEIDGTSSSGNLCLAATDAEGVESADNSDTDCTTGSSKDLWYKVTAGGSDPTGHVKISATFDGASDAVVVTEFWAGYYQECATLTSTGAGSTVSYTFDEDIAASGVHYYRVRPVSGNAICNVTMSATRVVPNDDCSEFESLSTSYNIGSATRNADFSFASASGTALPDGSGDTGTKDLFYNFSSTNTTIHGTVMYSGKVDITLGSISSGTYTLAVYKRDPLYSPCGGLTSNLIASRTGISSNGTFTMCLDITEGNYLVRVIQTAGSDEEITVAASSSSASPLNSEGDYLVSNTSSSQTTFDLVSNSFTGEDFDLDNNSCEATSLSDNGGDITQTGKDLWYTFKTASDPSCDPTVSQLIEGITVTLSSSATTGYVHLELYTGMSDGAYVNGASISSGNGSTTFTGLSANTRYYLRVEESTTLNNSQFDISAAWTNPVPCYDAAADAVDITGNFAGGPCPRDGSLTVYDMTGANAEMDSDEDVWFKFTQPDNADEFGFTHIRLQNHSSAYRSMTMELYSSIAGVPTTKISFASDYQGSSSDLTSNSAYDEVFINTGNLSAAETYFVRIVMKDLLSDTDEAKFSICIFDDNGGHFNIECPMTSDGNVIVGNAVECEGIAGVSGDCNLTYRLNLTPLTPTAWYRIEVLSNEAIATPQVYGQGLNAPASGQLNDYDNPCNRDGVGNQVVSSGNITSPSSECSGATNGKWVTVNLIGSGSFESNLYNLWVGAAAGSNCWGLDLCEINVIGPFASDADAQGGNVADVNSLYCAWFDYGDLDDGSDTYPEVYGIYDDENGDGFPDNGVWLGASIDAENTQTGNIGATGDDNTGSDDEDGFSVLTPGTAGGTGEIRIVGNAVNAGTTVYVGMWMDWDGDGFEASEFYSGSGVSNSPVNIDITVNVPADFISGDEAKVMVKAGLSAFAFEDAASNVINGEIEGHVLSFNDMILPVEYLEFDAVNVGDYNHISWVTASEENSDYFVIEKSADGINYDELGTVTAAGFSTEYIEYNYIDENPLAISYYRLKNVDFDGQFAYSKVVVVNGESTEAVEDFTFFPNPNKTGELNFIIDANRDETTQLEIRDITGRIVVRESLLLSRGINARQVDLNNLANATYFVTLQGYNETQSKRLVIQK